MLCPLLWLVAIGMAKPARSYWLLFSVFLQTPSIPIDTRHAVHVRFRRLLSRLGYRLPPLLPVRPCALTRHARSGRGSFCCNAAQRAAGQLLPAVQRGRVRDLPVALCLPSTRRVGRVRQACLDAHVFPNSVLVLVPRWRSGDRESVPVPGPAQVRQVQAGLSPEGWLLRQVRQRLHE